MKRSIADIHDSAHDEPGLAAKRIRQIESGREGSSSESDKKKRKKRKKSSEKSDDFSTVVATEVAVDEDEELYPYPIDSADHCETPVEAYSHIANILEMLAQSIGKTRASISIYDPYYCQGGMIQRLASLGFLNVYNKKENFYTIDSQPPYDVLITNPPYSGENIPKLLQFCEASKKPWLVLVPNYVYTKPYYYRYLQAAKADSTTQLFFYIAPKKRYLYVTPNGRRQQKSSKYTSPFDTFWYCNVPATNTLGLSGLKESVRRGIDWKDTDLSFFTPSSLPMIHLDERDDKKKRERNAMKRKKNKARKSKAKAE